MVHRERKMVTSSTLYNYFILIMLILYKNHVNKWNVYSWSNFLFFRSASSASQYPAIPRISSQHYGGSLPYGIDSNFYQRQSPRPASPFIVQPPPAFMEQEFKSPSEFNASNFDLVLASSMRNPNNILSTGLPLVRTQSMLNLSSNTGAVRNELTPRKAMSVVDYPAMPMRKRSYSTVSLDRRNILSRRNSHSFDIGHFGTADRALRNAYFMTDFRKAGLLFPTDSNPEYTHPGFYTYNVTNYVRPRRASRKESIGNESDDLRKYRDVALWKFCKTV